MISSCGFQLHNTTQLLPKKIGIVMSIQPRRYSVFNYHIRWLLSEKGVEITDNLSEAVVIVNIFDERIIQRALATNINNTKTEYLLEYMITYSIYDSNGKLIVSRNTIQANRIISIKNNQILSFENTKDLSLENMSKDLTSQILYQLSIR